MIQKPFILSDWADRLTDCLQELVSFERSLEGELVYLRQRAEMSLGLPGNAPHDSTDNVRERVSRYTFLAHPEPRTESEYRQFVSQRLIKLQELLLEHPTLADCAYRSKGYWVLNLDLCVSRVTGHQMVFMLQSLVAHAIEHTPKAAANALVEVISRGENYDLSSNSVLLFRGLHVERKYDFPSGLSIISFEEARQYLSGESVRSLLEVDTAAGRQPIAAVVSEVKWGPAIVPADYDMEAEWPVRSKTFRDDALLLVDLLAVTHRLSVVSTGWTTSVMEREIEHVLGRVPSFSRIFRDVQGANPLNSALPTTPAVSEGTFSECAELLSEMPRNDVILRMALSRLASSLSRSGIHAPLDRIVDVAIALEVMYQLDVSRGKGGQLSRRARDFVGQDRGDRNWIKRTAESIYRTRSDVAHGRLPEDTAQLHLDGLELARRTLAHLVHHGWPSDWGRPLITRAHL